jgi:hypothetical protein
MHYSNIKLNYIACDLAFHRKHMPRGHCEISTGNCGKILRDSKWYFQLTVIANGICYTLELLLQALTPLIMVSNYEQVFFSMAQQPLVGQGLLIVKAS